ncbi:MAG TPA: ATP phosphoribosyltransferase [Actinomycetaceae bacterium]|nr:ATP phosphoribosyltransferase [Actinomycetaceae bacterium]
MTAAAQEKKVLTIGLPKGSLQDATVALFAKAGFHISISSRGYFPAIDDDEIECMLIRPQEASRYVEKGLLDLAVTGFDWMLGRDVIEVAELEYSKQLRRPVRWVIAVPMDSPIRTLEDLRGKRIATEAVELTEKFLRGEGIEAEVEFSWGATEVKAPYLADAIVDVTETGSSLKANNLRIVHEILSSTTRLIASRAAMADDFKRAKIGDVAMLLQAALEAQGKSMLVLNVHADNLIAVEDLLPALKSPTVSQLKVPDWFAVSTIVNAKDVRYLIPRLKDAGAEDILELPLAKVVE